MWCCCRVLLCTVALAPGLRAQEWQNGPADSVQLVPGPHCGANWLQRWLLGGNYRDLWTQPVTVERLDLSRGEGGLPADCRGSAPSLRHTPAVDLLRNHAVSRHPVGTLVVSPLLEAASVLHVEPRLGMVPDSGGPDVSGDASGSVLATLEERPGDGFAGSDRVESTEGLWALMDASPAERPDARAYLTARLVDILVGDADRGPTQWSWAGYAADRGHLWRPIPRGRGLAFARLDGVVLAVARRYFPQLVSFGPDYPDLYGLTWSARAADRRLLVGLEKPQWDSIARALQGRLTDRVLEAAVARLPREMRQRSGAELLLALMRRRDQLREAADRFYPLVAEYADVRGTDRDEWAEVERLGRSVRVRIGLAEEPGVPYFDRTFPGEETREVRLDLAGGDDRVIVRGSAPRSARVRVVGGSGKDVMVDSSLVGLPLIRRVFTTTFFYDADADGELAAGEGTEVNRATFRPPKSSGVGDPFRDWGSRRVPMPWFSYQPALGLLIGAGVKRETYGFRKAPYASRQTLRGAFATGPRRVRVWYEGEFRNLPRGAWASLGFRYSGLDLLRFYGFGNETAIAAPRDFYRVDQRRIAAAASLVFFPPRSRLSIGPFFAFAETEAGRGGLIDSLRPYGVDRFVEAGAEARVEVDTRDRTSVPRRGVHVVATVRLVPRALDAVASYGSVSGEAATYLSAGDPARVTLALRAGGTRVWGRYPFHAAAFLGGASSVRGFDQQRFAGDAALYGNAELRLFLVRLSVPLPADLGVLGLGDVGRVFMTGESSGRWHRAVGGGLWLAFIERGSTITLTAARSPERWAYYGGLGFTF